MAYIKEYWNDKEKRATLAVNHTNLMESIYKNEIEKCVTDTIVYDINFTNQKALTIFLICICQFSSSLGVAFVNI